MKPSVTNGVMVHPIGNDNFVGFWVEDANDGFLEKFINENYKQKVAGNSTVEEATERLQPARQAIEEKGYIVGPVETKTHKEWCVEVLGADPDEYDRANENVVEFDEEE